MRKTTSFIFIFLSVTISLYSQNQKKEFHLQIVESNNKKPLPFATILINKNQHNGVVTDLNGRATINLLPGDSCIQISYIGYKTKLLEKRRLRKSSNLTQKKLNWMKLLFFQVKTRLIE